MIPSSKPPLKKFAEGSVVVDEQRLSSETALTPPANSPDLEPLEGSSASDRSSGSETLNDAEGELQDWVLDDAVRNFHLSAQCLEPVEAVSGDADQQEGAEAQGEVGVPGGEYPYGWVSGEIRGATSNHNVGRSHPSVLQKFKKFVGAEGQGWRLELVSDDDVVCSSAPDLKFFFRCCLL